MIVGMDSFGYYDGSTRDMCAAVEAGHGTDGAGALHYTAVGGTPYSLPATVDSVQNKCIVGGWLKLGNGGVWSPRGVQLLGYQLSGDTHMSMVSGTDGLLEIWRDFGGGGGTLIGVSSTPLVDPDTWYFLECFTFFDTSFGQTYVRVQGRYVLALVSADLGLTSGPDLIEFSPATSDGAAYCDVSWDDVYVVDGNGAVNNNFISHSGYAKIACCRPNGVSVWSHQDPIYDWWRSVNDVVPDEDTTCIVGGGAGTYANQYAMSDIPWDPAYVAGVQVVVRTRGGEWWTGHAKRPVLWVYSGGGAERIGRFQYGDYYEDGGDSGDGTQYAYGKNLWNTYLVGFPGTETQFDVRAVNYSEVGYDMYADPFDPFAYLGWFSHRNTQIAMEVLYSPLYVPPGGRRPWAQWLHAS